MPIDTKEIKGKNNTLNQDEDYFGLYFHPHSEVKFLEHNVKLINDTDKSIIVCYSEAWNAFETGPRHDFYGLKSELLGEETFGR